MIGKDILAYALYSPLVQIFQKILQNALAAGFLNKLAHRYSQSFASLEDQTESREI